MPAKDVFHTAVKNALINSGWELVDENFELKLIEDLHKNGSEVVMVFEKDNEKIAVLVEQFLSSSRLQDFHFALGRYLNCRLFLSKINLDSTLFSAITTEDNENLFKMPFVQKLVVENKMKLIIYDFRNEELKGWNKNLRIPSLHFTNKEDAKLFARIIEDL